MVDSRLVPAPKPFYRWLVSGRWGSRGVHRLQVGPLRGTFHTTGFTQACMQYATCLVQVANTEGACLDCETCSEDEAEMSADGFQVSGPWVFA